MDVLADSVGKTIELLGTSSALPLYLISVGGLVLVGLSLYFGVQYGENRAKYYNYVVGDIDTMADRMREAEKIGKFGSFLWDFEHPDASFWTEELYALLDLEYQRRPPSLEEFVGFAYEKDRDKVRAAWERVKVTSGSFMFAFRAISKTGRLLHLKVQGKMTPGKTLGPRQIEGVVTDVTKEMEVDQAKSEFVSLASHQLKTPLTSIRWLAEALIRGTAGKLAPEQEKYVTNMHDASRRMMDMVNDLLNVSRIETDTLAVKPESINVCELAQSVVDEQKPSADEKHLTLTLVCADNIPMMSVDKNLVRMIFQNLLSNAIKYTPQGGSVACDISLAAAVRETIFVSVKDSGIGIPKEEQSRVFEKLHRASNAEALVPDGTGLGLYLVKTIVDKVGGGITFESIESKGTTFFVSIPVTWKASGDKPLAA